MGINELTWWCCVDCRTRLIVMTSTKATSTTLSRWRRGSSARSCLSASTSDDRPVSPSRPTGAPSPRHVTSSCGTPSQGRSSTAATTRHPPPTDSTSSTTVSTNAAGADHSPLEGVAPFSDLFGAIKEGQNNLLQFLLACFLEGKGTLES